MVLTNKVLMHGPKLNAIVNTASIITKLPFRIQLESSFVHLWIL